MRVLNYKAEYRKLLTPELVSCLTRIHEQKGRQNLFIEIHKDAFYEMAEITNVWNAEASNRLEGILITDDRLKKIMMNKTTPKGRDECETAGYRDVLNSIRENHDFIPVRPGEILQLHRDLYKFCTCSDGGIFKDSDNMIEQEQPEGISLLRFQPVPAWETPEAVEKLCSVYQEALTDTEMDPLLLIPVFVLDFLCIYPFRDGNGRMSRLLTLLLLYRSGYYVGKYISIEKLIEDSEEAYYEALRESVQGWHEGENDYLPFVRYMLGIVNAAYQEFSSKADLLVTRGLSKPGRVREIIRSETGRITKAQIMKQCPDISQKTVERALTELMANGEIIKISGGRYTSYIWNREKE